MGLKKRGYLILGILFLLILYFDKLIIKGVSYLRFEFLTNFFIGFTNATVIIIFFVLGSLFLFIKKENKWILPLWVSLALSGIISFILKIIFRIERPYQQGLISAFPLLTNLNHFAWNMSFPSSHAMIAFCALPILFKKRPKFRLIWLILAILVALSRVYLGLHFLSDVFVGSIIGYFIGLGIIRFEEKYNLIEYNYKIILKKFKRK